MASAYGSACAPHEAAQCCAQFASAGRAEHASKGHAGASARQYTKDCLAGLGLFALFTAFAAEPARLLPSNLRFPGACRAYSIPAPGQGYATDTVKKALLEEGLRKTGCHSCGARHGL